MKNKGFTLIELLVVIAIIAILAAILFPVFAQAKESAKKATALTQQKQCGTSAQIYIADYDDNYPLAMSWDSTLLQYRWTGLVAVPAGAITDAGRSVDPRKTEESNVIYNSIQPYMKNFAIFEAPGKATVTRAFTRTPGVKGAKINATFNGMLHGWNASAIEAPSKCPLFWQGMFAANMDTVVISSPQLECDAPAPANTACRFNPGQLPQPNAQGSPYGYGWFAPMFAANRSTLTMWVYGRGMIFTSTDSSARFVNLGNLPVWPNFSTSAVNSNPFSSVDNPAAGATPGEPYWMVDCVSPGRVKGSEVYYPGFFRPDSDFNWDNSECDAGGG